MPLSHVFTANVATALPLVELGSRLALAHFNGAGDKKPVVNSPALAARAAANPGFVNFNMLAGLAADPVPVRPNHASAELVEDLKGGLVAGEPDLALELFSRHAERLAGNQIGRQSHTPSGVWLRSMTVPAVSLVSRRHFRQRKTPGRPVKRNGSPAA